MHKWADNVVEESTTTTTGAYQLGGVPASGERPGTQTFVAGIGNANTCDYYAYQVGGSAYEFGTGTVTDAAPDTLSRDTIVRSSNGGSAVDWTGLTVRVVCVLASRRIANPPSYPFASLPPAAGNGGLIAAVSDIGNGALFVSNGTRWRPANGHAMLAQRGVPVGIAPSGSVAANGALTLGTALDVVYSNGLWLYFPAGALYAGSVAGLYWCVMSSTALGTIYNDTYDGSVALPDIPASPTPIVAAGPGAFTGVTNSHPVLGVTIPGGAIGPHGRVVFKFRTQNNNSAELKYLYLRMNNANTGWDVVSSTNTHLSGQVSMQNVGKQVAQVITRSGAIDFVGGTSNSLVRTAYDTSVDNTVQLALAHVTSATNWVILQSIEVELIA